MHVVHLNEKGRVCFGKNCFVTAWLTKFHNCTSFDKRVLYRCMPQEGDCKHPLLFESFLFLVLSVPSQFSILTWKTAVAASGDIPGSLLPTETPNAKVSLPRPNNNMSRSLTSLSCEELWILSSDLIHASTALLCTSQVNHWVVHFLSQSRETEHQGSWWKSFEFASLIMKCTCTPNWSCIPLLGFGVYMCVWCVCMCVQYVLTSTVMESQRESVSPLHLCSWLIDEANFLIYLVPVLECAVTDYADIVSRSANAE